MRILCTVFSVLLCLSLFSCSSGEPTANEILYSIIEGSAPLPAGVVYSPSAEVGDKEYLSPALAEALWGEDAQEGFSLLEDYSIYLSSFAKPYEIGVFVCYSATDAVRIEELCRSRADIVSVSLRQTEFFDLCQSIRICRSGRYVVFLMTPNTYESERIAKRLIR